MSSKNKFTEEILKHSQSKIWDIAKLEWRLHDIYEAEKPETCLCGKFPIIEICILQNNLNAQLVIVGNCCVKKFFGLPSDKFLKAVRRVHIDNQKSLNAEVIQYAYEKNWINEWECDFLIDNMRKINLTDSQLQTRIKINEKLLANMKRECVLS